VTLNELQASPNSDYYYRLHYASAQLPKLQSATVLVNFVSIFYINNSSVSLAHVKDLPSNKRPTRHKVIHYQAQFGISRKVYKDHR